MVHMGRRSFIVMSGAAALGIGLGASTSHAAEEKSKETKIYEDASNKRGIPVTVLAAFAHCQSRWQDHGGRPSVGNGFGPMHLIDAAERQRGLERAGKHIAAFEDTLENATKISGIPADKIRNDAASNVEAGAALLAHLQKKGGHPVGADTKPEAWYLAVARASGMSTIEAQSTFADRVMKTVASGQKEKMADGRYLVLEKSEVGSVEAQKEVLLQSRVDEKPAPPPAEKKKVEIIPSPYEKYGESEKDYGNHDRAFRPKAPAINYIIIHDTECSWDVAIKMVKDPKFVSWNYTIRSNDGHVAQHLKHQDIGWHCGSWWFNMHSIGIEHEGHAARGHRWYTEPMYASSAELVKNLCEELKVPMDRSHIIGHDQIPGEKTEQIPKMHWDPGPFWDWEHFFELLGAPLSQGTSTDPIKAGDVIRILPGFKGNAQPLTACGKDGPCEAGNTNFVPLHTKPSTSSELVRDPGLRPKGDPTTTQVSDIGARAIAGTEFVVAKVEKDWTAIWYLGTLGWFHNPPSAPKARKVTEKRTIATTTAKTKIYGRAVPEKAAYKDASRYQEINSLVYKVEAGQKYVVGDLNPPTAYYWSKSFSMDTPNDHVLITGKDRYALVSFGHRLAFMKHTEVTLG
ncbi:N-acetylmuramoyl-L-alanine amidase [Austwickia chelonae]|uniref:N-acetylmuramoyl-L-alanine amidase n=2 Tax=Austwickia TaxID=1184606 RepID=K6V4K3_9MICO|nr:putative amidase [Austwickia chelonae NBRC 105200]SEW33679.1 N-acetylmuramoyl-L-alanine amidase [Austwickia chelonae]